MANVHERFMEIAMEEAPPGRGRGQRRGRLGGGARRGIGRPRAQPGCHAVRPHRAMRRRWPCATPGPRWGTPTSPDSRSTPPSSPARLCCGAILASGVSTVVLGARFSDGSSRWGRLRGGEAARSDRTRRRPARHHRGADRAMPRSAATGSVVSRYLSSLGPHALAPSSAESVVARRRGRVARVVSSSLMSTSSL